MDETTRLLLAARDGDRFSLAAWIRRTQPEVWRLCSHLVDHQAADDLTQETYLRAWRALPAFRGHSSARTWLLAIARRTCADALRLRTRQRRLAARLTPSPAQPDPADEFALHALLRTLDPDRREAFVLTQLLGLSYDQTAQICGCPVGTIRSRVARARTHLITSLQAAERKDA